MGTGGERGLRVEGLTKSYDGETVIDDVSFAVEDGTLQSLLGPSGCGKTTTLRCIAGLERPDRGRIYIGDELVTDPVRGVHVPPANRGIGMVFQSFALWPHMTVADNVRYPLDVQGIGSSDGRTERVLSILDTVGLRDHAEKYPANLSGGQRQRVAISRAIVTEPEILLFDEPLSNLDSSLRRKMRLEIKELCEKLGTTALYVTHSQDEAMFLSDRLSLLFDNRIVEEGKPRSLYADPQTYFGLTFMGECNTVEGTLRSVSDSSAVVSTPMGDLITEGANDSLSPNDDVIVGFRPKACRICNEDESSIADGGAVLDGTVTMRAVTRDFVEYRVETESETILVRSSEPQSLSVRDSVRVTIPPADIHVYDRSAALRYRDGA